jgi:hypothetical protein
MIHLQAGRYYEGLWFVTFDGGDWLSCLWKEGETLHETAQYPWILQHRIRLPHSPEIWGHADEKRWQEIELTALDRTTAVTTVDLVIPHLEIQPLTVEYFPIQGNSQRFKEQLQSTQAPRWLHSREDLGLLA